MDGIDCRQDVVDEAIRQHAAGSIITLMWHAARPTGEEPVTFLGDANDAAAVRALFDEPRVLHRPAR